VSVSHPYALSFFSFLPSSIKFTDVLLHYTLFESRKLDCLLYSNNIIIKKENSIDNDYIDIVEGSGYSTSQFRKNNNQKRKINRQ